jgi:3-oxoacyl-[acyl-carrier-protein] synthase II
MAQLRDKSGRPIVVVTGMGVVTALGAGKTDNWAKLTAGKSGIRAITRFSTENFKTRVAGTVDFVPVEPLSAPALAERLAELAVEEALAESAIGSRGNFPGPLFLAVAPIEIEWPQRQELAQVSRTNGDVNYDDLLRSAASGLSSFSRAVSVRIGWLQLG